METKLEEQARGKGDLSYSSWAANNTESAPPPPAKARGVAAGGRAGAWAGARSGTPPSPTGTPAPPPPPAQQLLSGEASQQASATVPSGASQWNAVRR